MKIEHTKNYLIISTSVLITCVLLFFLDKEVNNFSDLFHNLPAFFTYSAPTFCACLFLYKLFLRKKDKSESLYLCLAVGLPTGILSVMAILLLLGTSQEINT